MKNSLTALLFFLCLQCFSQVNSVDSNKTPIRTSVAVSSAQLSGKWNISKILNPKQVELPADKVSGSYFTFADDGTYTAMIMGVEEKGEWKSGPENKSVFLFSKGMKTIWNFLSASDTEITMQKGIRGNTVVFTR